MEEIWKTVPDAPNYEVSNTRRVRNKRTGRELRITRTGDAARVTLMSFGQRMDVLVNDLILAAFHKNRPLQPVTNEVWRRIGYAWGYEVSDEGRVRNVRTQKVLKPYTNPRNGRDQVTLTDDGYRITRSIYLLVKEAFGG